MSAIVDADSHLYEQPDMWREYADPADRDDALHLQRDANGWDWVSWCDRRILETVITTSGDFSSLGPALERCRQGEQCDFDYGNDLPEHYWSGAARAAMLDDIGTDESIVFPHWGLNWLERQLAALAAGGIKLGWIPAGLVNGLPPSHPDLDRAWSLFDTYGINPVFHVGANPNRVFEDAWFEGHHSHFTPLLSFPLLGMDVFVTLLDLVLNCFDALTPLATASCRSPVVTASN